MERQETACQKAEYSLKAKTSFIQPNVHFVTFITAHLSMARKNVWHAITRLRRSQSKAISFTRRASLHVMRPIFHADAGRRGQKRRTQSALTRCASLHVSRFPDGSDAVRKDTHALTVFFASVVAGNCLFDMASKGCGQKRHTIRTGTTIWRQSPTHEVTNRDCHIPLTTHFIMIHTLFLMAKICLLQVLACIKRRDPCHVPPQTDPIIVHKRQALRSKQQHHDISKMS